MYLLKFYFNIFHISKSLRSSPVIALVTVKNKLINKDETQTDGSMDVIDVNYLFLYIDI